jgi:ADP-heptose:LPS heptosyltransferase
MPKPPKHILVIRLSAMGDVAMTVPVIRAFTKQYPNVRITVLTRSFLKPFFYGIKNVSVFNAEVKSKHKGILGLWKLSKELKELDIDAVADLHNVLRSKILKGFLNRKPFIQIDKGRPEKKALISGQNFSQLKPTHQRYADVFERLGFKLDLSKPSFPPKRELNANCVEILGEYDALIGIAPFAAFDGKSYPLSLMETVIEELSKSYQIVMFGGGQSEIKQLENLESKFENVINLAGNLDLTEELDVISNLEIMISMDSGNAHIAAMLGIKVLTLWGVTHPYAGFFPFNQDVDNALLADREKYPLIPTSIYGNKYPPGYEMAIETITPQNVIEKVGMMISEDHYTSS